MLNITTCEIQHRREPEESCKRKSVVRLQALGRALPYCIIFMTGMMSGILTKHTSGILLRGGVLRISYTQRCAYKKSGLRREI